MCQRKSPGVTSPMPGHQPTNLPLIYPLPQACRLRDPLAMAHSGRPRTFQVRAHIIHKSLRLGHMLRPAPHPRPKTSTTRRPPSTRQRPPHLSSPLRNSTTSHHQLHPHPIVTTPPIPNQQRQGLSLLPSRHPRSTMVVTVTAGRRGLIMSMTWPSRKHRSMPNGRYLHSTSRTSRRL